MSSVISCCLGSFACLSQISGIQSQEDESKFCNVEITGKLV